MGKFILGIAVCAAAFVGWQVYNMPPTPPEQLPEVVSLHQATAGEVKGRFKVERVGTFKDSLAYDNERGIYVLKDAQTGAEYVGISGVGISEVARHGCGKSCSAEDER